MLGRRIVGRLLERACGLVSVVLDDVQCVFDDRDQWTTVERVERWAVGGSASSSPSLLSAPGSAVALEAVTGGETGGEDGDDAAGSEDAGSTSSTMVLFVKLSLYFSSIFRNPYEATHCITLVLSKHNTDIF